MDPRKPIATEPKDCIDVELARSPFTLPTWKVTLDHETPSNAIGLLAPPSEDAESDLHFPFLS